MGIGLVGIGVCLLGTFLHSRCRGSRRQRGRSSFIFRILNIFHLQILFPHEVSIYTVQSSVRENDSFLNRLIMVSFGRRKWGKYWWCSSILLSLFLHFYISGWRFMARVNRKDHICTKYRKGQKFLG